MANETLEEQVRKLQEDLAALTERVEQIERERKSEKDTQARDDLQFKSYGG